MTTPRGSARAGLAAIVAAGPAHSAEQVGEIATRTFEPASKHLSRKPRQLVVRAMAHRLNGQHAIVEASAIERHAGDAKVQVTLHLLVKGSLLPRLAHQRVEREAVTGGCPARRQEGSGDRLVSRPRREGSVWHVLFDDRLNVENAHCALVERVALGLLPSAQTSSPCLMTHSCLCARTSKAAGRACAAFPLPLMLTTVA